MVKDENGNVCSTLEAQRERDGGDTSQRSSTFTVSLVKKNLEG